MCLETQSELPTASVQNDDPPSDSEECSGANNNDEGLDNSEEVEGRKNILCGYCNDVSVMFCADISSVVSN